MSALQSNASECSVMFDNELPMPLAGQVRVRGNRDEVAACVRVAVIADNLISLDLVMFDGPPNFEDARVWVHPRHISAVLA